MSILFKNAAVLATEDGKFKYLENAYLGTDGAFIDYIGLQKPAKAYDTETDMSGKMLIPGLVNSHTHTAMVLLRGVGSGLPLQQWLETIWPLEDKMTDYDLEVGTDHAILEMLACGTTSFTDMYTHPSHTQVCVARSGIKANMSSVFIFGFDEPSYEDFYRRKDALMFYRDYNNTADGRLKTDFGIHAEYTNRPDFVEKLVAEASVFDTRLHIHLSETKKEHDECVKKYGKTPAKWFDDLGAFDMKTIAAHCVWCTDDDLDLMAKKGVSPVMNPSSNLKLGSGIVPVAKMHKRNMNVCVGTDGAASNNNLNMFEELHIATILDSNNKPDEMLRAATVNGARAQGRFDTGELVVGKRADIVAVNMDAPHLVPNIDPVALVVYSAQASDVCMTMVDGKILYKDGEFLTMDRDRILAESKAVSLKLLR